MAAHQAPPSLGFSRQEHWSGLPFSSPICMKVKSESEVAQACLSLKWPHGLQPTRLLRPGIFQARVLEWVAIAFSLAIWSVLILPIKEYRISFHIFLLSSIFNNFLEYRFFTLLVKFIPRYFILFDLFWSEIVFLISLSDSSLLVSRKMISFCILILYLTTLLNPFILIVSGWRL